MEAVRAVCWGKVADICELGAATLRPAQAFQAAPSALSVHGDKLLICEQISAAAAIIQASTREPGTDRSCEGSCMCGSAEGIKCLSMPTMPSGQAELARRQRTSVHLPTRQFY